MAVILVMVKAVVAVQTLGEPVNPLPAKVLASVKVCPRSVTTNFATPTVVVSVPRFAPAAQPAIVAVPPEVRFPATDCLAPSVALT